MRIIFTIILIILLSSLKTHAQIVSTYAGTGGIGNQDGPRLTATFLTINYITIDNQGNVYVSDYQGHKIRKISTDGMVSTLAGTGVQGDINGSGSSARLRFPTGIDVDSEGNVYFADSGNFKIKKITPSGFVTTVSGSGVMGDLDGAPNLAKFNLLYDLKVDHNGNIFVADYEANKVKKIIPDGTVSTYAGTGVLGETNGPALSAMLNNPRGIAVDNLGNVFFSELRKIRKISADGIVSDFAGSGNFSNTPIDGSGDMATFNNPRTLDIDSQGNIYAGEQEHTRIRKITPQRFVSTYAGTGAVGNADGPANMATFRNPNGVTVFQDTTLYIADEGNRKVRKIESTIMSTSEPLGKSIRVGQMEKIFL